MVSAEIFNNATAFYHNTRPPPKRMLPQPSLPISQPVKSAKYNASGGAPGSQNTTDSDSSDDQDQKQTALVHAKHDLLIWFEVLELASSGEYVPVMVDHCDDLPCRGVYFLHHGLQRRIRITIVHDRTKDLRWKDVRELVVGRIRFVYTLLAQNTD